MADGFFFMERPKLGAELWYEYEKDESEGPFRNETGKTTTYFERLDIETEGFVYHPALIIYSLTLSPEWEQSREHRNQRTNTFNSSLSGFSTDMTIFQYKPYTLNLYGSRYSETLRSNISERTRIDTTLYGSSISLSYQVLPTKLSYRHKESEHTGLFPMSTNEDIVDLFIRRETSFSNSSLNASYFDGNRNSSTSTSDTTRTFIAFRNITFLPKDRGTSLSSNITYNDTANTILPSKRLFVNETLSIEIKKNLNATLNLQHTRENMHDRRTDIPKHIENNASTFSINHTLYENLITNFIAGIQKSQSLGNKQIDYNTGINFSYARKIPWGHLRLQMGQRLTYVDIRKLLESSSASETVTLSSTSSTILSNANIEPASIRVLDINNVPYDEGADYTLSSINSFILLRCINSAKMIADAVCDTGNTVTVIYLFKSRFPFDYYLRNQSYSINLLLFSKLNIYSSIRKSKQHPDKGTIPNKLIDDTTTVYGAELNLDRSRTSIEFEDFRSQTSLPINRLTLNETLTFRPLDSMFFVQASFDYGFIQFKNTGDKDKFNAQNVSIQRSISDWGKIAIELFRKDVRGSVLNETDTGFSNIIEGIYNIYEWSIELTFEEEEDKASGVTLKNTYFVFKIKRNLF